MATKHDDTTRKVIHAKLCAPGAELLRAFCTEHGVTVAAFLDGLSHVLGTCPEAAPSPAVVSALKQARKIDADRRRRDTEPVSERSPNGTS